MSINIHLTILKIFDYGLGIKMKVLIYGINFSPELTGIGKYTGELAFWLAEKGHDIRVITAPPYYPEWKVDVNYTSYKYKKENIGNVQVIRCPLYVPKRISTIKRFLHLISFAVTSFFPMVSQIFWRPDIIINIAPTLFCTPTMLLIGKLTKAKTLLHIQDYEVDASLGLGMIKSGLLSKCAYSFEKWCLTRCDKVSSISKSMINRALEKGVKKENVIFFPNWSEIERFEHVNQNEIDFIKEKLKLPSDKKIILYSGNINEKQGLEILVEVAGKEIFKDSLFLVVGDGGAKDRLINMVKEKNITNIRFEKLQPYDLLPALLKVANCHLIIQRKGAADMVLPSKLTNILAVGGNTVITAELQTELGQLCMSFPGIAVLVHPESVEDLAVGILKVLELNSVNEIALSYAKNNLDKNVIISSFIEALSC